MSPLAKSVASLSSVTEDWKVAGEMTVMRVSSETAEQKPQVSCSQNANSSVEIA